MSQRPPREVVSAPESPETQESVRERGNERAGVQQQPGMQVPEIGGRVGPEPTRFGDWEKNGRCIDF